MNEFIEKERRRKTREEENKAKQSPLSSPD